MSDVLFNPSMNPAAILTHCAASLLLLACASANADLYTYIDESGVRHLSDSLADARYRLALAAPPPFPPHRCNR